MATESGSARWRQARDDEPEVLLQPNSAVVSGVTGRVEYFVAAPSRPLARRPSLPAAAHRRGAPRGETSLHSARAGRTPHTRRHQASRRHRSWTSPVDLSSLTTDRPTLYSWPWAPTRTCEAPCSCSGSALKQHPLDSSAVQQQRVDDASRAKPKDTSGPPNRRHIVAFTRS